MTLTTPPTNGTHGVRFCHSGGPPRGRAVEWLRDVRAALASGKTVTVAAARPISSVCLVVAVPTDAAGRPTGITLRGPTTGDRTITDMTRLSSCLTDTWTFDG